MPRRARDKDWEKKLKWGIGLLGVGAGVYFGHQAYQNWKAEKEIKEHGSHITPGGVNLQQVATEINDAFYNYAYGTMEDEEAAIDSLLTVPQESIKVVALLYNGINGKNLYSDFRQYLDNDQYARIKHLMQ